MPCGTMAPTSHPVRWRRHCPLGANCATKNEEPCPRARPRLAQPHGRADPLQHREPGHRGVRDGAGRRARAVRPRPAAGGVRHGDAAVQSGGRPAALAPAPAGGAVPNSGDHFSARGLSKAHSAAPAPASCSCSCRGGRSKQWGTLGETLLCRRAIKITRPEGNEGCTLSQAKPPPPGRNRPLPDETILPRKKLPSPGRGLSFPGRNRKLCFPHAHGRKESLPWPKGRKLCVGRSSSARNRSFDLFTKHMRVVAHVC